MEGEVHEPPRPVERKTRPAPVPNQASRSPRTTRHVPLAANAPSPRAATRGGTPTGRDPARPGLPGVSSVVRIAYSVDGVAEHEAVVAIAEGDGVEEARGVRG